MDKEHSLLTKTPVQQVDSTCRPEMEAEKQCTPQSKSTKKWEPSACVSQTVWSSYLSHMIAATMYQKSGVHLGPPTCCRYRGHTAKFICYLGSDQAASYLPHILATDSMKGLHECWHLHSSNCRNTMIYMHTTPRILPTCHMSLCSLTVGMPEARDFVGSIEQYYASSHKTVFGAKSTLMFWSEGKQVYSRYMSEVNATLSKKTGLRYAEE